MDMSAPTATVMVSRGPGRLRSQTQSYPRTTIVAVVSGTTSSRCGSAVVTAGSAGWERVSVLAGIMGLIGDAQPRS